MSGRRKVTKSKRTASPAVQPTSFKRRKKQKATWDEYDYYGEDVDRETRAERVREEEKATKRQMRSTAGGTFLFKDGNFEFRQATNKKRAWKNLKQILGNERILPWQQDDPTYSSIDATPSFKPAKKYCDLVGLPAKYQDPQTGMRFSTSVEFATIRTLPSDIVQNYLTIRRASTV